MNQNLFRSRKQKKNISKLMSLILRHRPKEFGIILDEYGFTEMDSLLAAMKKRFDWLDKAHIEDIVETSDKRRYEIQGDRIRANYGHSVPITQTLPVVVPPEILYHGTSPNAMKSIKSEGIKPMSRQKVHLSETSKTALEVGRRHSRTPVILDIKAKVAHENGIKFIRVAQTYLADAIPPEYIAFP